MKSDSSGNKTDHLAPAHRDQVVKRVKEKEMKRLEKNRLAREKYREERYSQQFFQLQAAAAAIEKYSRENGLGSK
jgi:hypothetical protein